MAISIDQKIVEYRVKTEGDKPANEPEETNVIQMHEKLERPEMLFGSTYKIKTPLSDHALFITVNDSLANPNTA